jgi:hypothetical protein
MHFLPPGSFGAMATPLQLLPLPGENMLEAVIVVVLLIFLLPIFVGFLIGILPSLPLIPIALIAVVQTVWDAVVGNDHDPVANGLTPPPADAPSGDGDRAEDDTAAESTGADPKNPTVVYTGSDTNAGSERSADSERQESTVVYTDDQ